ncbi:unnamed protein product [Rhizophagus irregularis]|nr:unnamed protein product [Rhizophagus irregularis]
MSDNKFYQNYPKLLEILNDEEYYDITMKLKNDGALVHIKLPNISPEIFQVIIRYIYGGKFLFGEYDTSDIIKILVAANKLNLQELVKYLQTSLIENNSDWIEKKF